MHPTDGSPEEWVVRWTDGEIRPCPDGGITVPVVIRLEGRPLAVTRMKLTLDQASVLHAQLDRHICQGWARTEQAKTERQRGERYPLGNREDSHG